MVGVCSVLARSLSPNGTVVELSRCSHNQVGAFSLDEEPYLIIAVTCRLGFLNVLKPVLSITSK